MVKNVLNTYLEISRLRFIALIYTLTVLLGAGMNLGLVWTIADIFNALMAIPNLIGLVFLSGVVVAETRSFKKLRAEEKLQQK